MARHQAGDSGQTPRQTLTLPRRRRPLGGAPPRPAERDAADALEARHHEEDADPAPTPSTQNQIRTDAWLMKDGAVEDAHRHLFASSSSNTLGADERVVDLLDAAGISYTIHLSA